LMVKRRWVRKPRKIYRSAANCSRILGTKSNGSTADFQRTALHSTTLLSSMESSLHVQWLNNA
jgi:hypothetical protein